MAEAYSQDLRGRVIDVVVGDGMSGRAVAARFGVRRVAYAIRRRRVRSCASSFSAAIDLAKA